MYTSENTKNQQDFISLQNKYFSHMQKGLTTQVLSLLKKRSLLFLNKKRKKLQQAKNDTTETFNKFKRIPISFLSVFNQESYLHANKDVKEGVTIGQFDNALEHFILYGYDEIKDGTRRIGNEFPFMTEEAYIQANPDIKAAHDAGSLSSVFEHFIAFGYAETKEGSRPLAGHYPFELTKKLSDTLQELFDDEAYLAANTDVEEAIEKKLFENAWEHFVTNGLEEVSKGIRSLHPKLPPISESQYVTINKDVFAALQRGEISSPFQHFLLSGAQETLDGLRKIPGVSMYAATPVFSKKIKQEIKDFNYKPLISVVMPVYNVDVKWLELAIASLKAQWYPHWEICIADDKSTKKETVDYLKSLNDPQIKITFLDKNVNISGASNAALTLSKGEYIALMDNDDELREDALYEVVKTINETQADFIYSDEDKLDIDATYCDPHFKPDYAPDMFMSQNYISHLTVIKKTLIDKVGGWELGLEGAQDYDLYLKVLEHTNNIVHIPKVLYHWRKIPGSTAAEFSDKSYAQEAGRIALENACKRRDIAAKIENGKYPGTYRVKYAIKGNPLVSIVIPFKDKPELLDMCINSILDKSTYQNYEIIGMSNNSDEPETFEMMEQLSSKDERITFYEYNEPFNYSAINNYAVKNYAKGEHIILLNNDIEIISSEWIEAMLEFSQREDVGVVGAKLYYPDDTIQHAGVIIGLGGVAGHSHKYFPNDSGGYFLRLHIVQNISAITAACFMVKKTIFNDVNGLNENDLKIAFNDVDFCLRIREQDYLNVYTPYCEAYHHESISRGAEDNPEKIARFNKEVNYMKERHKSILTQGDPYYNVNLTLDHENFGLKA